MMLSGCGSNMRTRTYRFFSSYATWNSVLCVGSTSTLGSNWRKPENRGAVSQAGSSVRPSMRGGSGARTADAVATAELVEATGRVVGCAASWGTAVATTSEAMMRLGIVSVRGQFCLLYTSDAADERSSVDLGGRRIIK